MWDKKYLYSGEYTQPCASDVIATELVMSSSGWGTLKQGEVLHITQHTEEEISGEQLHSFCHFSTVTWEFHHQSFYIVLC